MSRLPIFYDPKKRRRKLFISLTIIFVIVAVFSIASVVSGVIARPLLPLPKSFNAIVAGKHLHSIPEKIRQGQDYLKSLGTGSGTTKEPAYVTDAINLQGFYVEWDDAAYQSLQENVHKIGALSMEELTLSGSGEVKILNAERFKRSLNFVKTENPEVETFALINNFSESKNLWDSDLLRQTMNDENLRSKLVANLVNFVDQNQMDGVNIDFEEVPNDAFEGYYQFLQELGDQLHQYKRKLEVEVPVANDSYDVKRISTLVDFVILMAYDEHWFTGEPGPVASLAWFRDHVKSIAANVPPEKLTVAIGNYGYDWTLGAKNTAVALTFQEAHTTARESEGDIVFDHDSLNPTFSYADEENRDHEVWYLDGATAYDEIITARDFGLDNFALWRMGSEDPSFWKLLESKKFEDGKAPQELEDFGYGYDVNYMGSGELYRITEAPKMGKRNITFTDELVTDEKITDYPLPYTITKYGSQPKKIALTFDDGPDPTYTPAILDILRDTKTPATFFVVGDQAESHPELVKRIEKEGHTIGNHTFTHPDISKIGNTRTEFELNLTERLIESIIGRSTILFRPPYGEDIEPEIPQQVAPLERSNALGYITVGMKIDPNDWQATASRDAIVQNVLDQARAGKGNVVLLHDSGGNRSQTVAALPQIISELRKEGFEIVSLADLMGTTRDAMMPVVTGQDRVMIFGDSMLFTFVRIFSWIIYTIFFIYLIVGIFRLAMVVVFAVIHKYVEKKRVFDPDYLPKVAIIVPAFNEEKVILRTVESLLGTTYRGNYEILVVDDGSKDNTCQRVIDTFGTHPKVRPFKKVNEGKGEAINFGMNETDAEIIIVIDADTLFEPETIPLLVRHFNDPDIVAVSGNVKVGNRTNLLTRMQAFEYITGQNLDRRAYDMLQSNTVVPGAIGAWRRKVVLEVGGFSSDTLAEDSDLTVTLLRAGWRVVHENEALAYTEAPEDWKIFRKQRFRWTFGILQVAFKHADAIFDSKASWSLRLFVLPHTILSQTVFPVIAPLADIGTLLALALSIANALDPGVIPGIGSLWHIFGYVVVFLILDVVTGLLAFAMERNEPFRLVLIAPIQRLVYRFFMHGIYLRSVKTALTGKLATGKLRGWETFERTNTAKAGK